MQYGYFDGPTREYVITRPDTPAPWANYLGSPEYGALISNNAGAVHISSGQRQRGLLVGLLAAGGQILGYISE